MLSPILSSSSSSSRRCTNKAIVPVVARELLPNIIIENSTRRAFMRRSGLLSPTSTLHHPIVNLIMRIIIPLMPLAIEYFEDYIRREKARRQQEAEAARPMSKPLTIDEALDVLAIDPRRLAGANEYPLPPGSAARRVADENFKKFFAMCQPQIAAENKEFFFGTTAANDSSSNDGDSGPEGKSKEKKRSAGFGDTNQPPPIPRNDYLAGKFSGAYRVLVDLDWDRDLKIPDVNNNTGGSNADQQQQQQHQQQNSDNNRA